MKFIVDKQTLEDLNIPGKYKADSVYNLFNKVKTSGGERLLDKMFNSPLTDANEINERSMAFRYIQSADLSLPFKTEVFNIMENYLTMTTNKNYLSAIGGILRKKVMKDIFHDEQHEILDKGLRATWSVLHELRKLLEGFSGDVGNPYLKKIHAINTVLFDEHLQWLSEKEAPKSMPTIMFAKYEYTLKHLMRIEIENLLESIYYLDVLIAVSSVSRERGFSYALALSSENEQIITSSELSHPCLMEAISNPIKLDQKGNVLFLTGANMAGKSTFMKSFGIAVYLAHMGFPVAAKDMIFSVRDGLYSSINVSDNLGQGYSHFYAEVLRIKDVATEVGKSRNLVVIFDELFKGTNVKDAYDATLSITTAFSKYRNCFFIISTHIVEVGEELKQQYDNIQFKYLPTIMEGAVPRYTYKLREGITTDRHGMMIIRNEGILDIILSNNI